MALGAHLNVNAQSLQWAYTFGKAGDAERALAVTTDGQGNVYTAGYFKDTLDFDPGPDSVKTGSTGYGNAFILKMDAAGHYIKHYAFGITTGGNKTVACNMKFDATGNLYTAGYFTGNNVDFDPDTSVYKIDYVGSGNNGFLMKMDATGKFAWAKNWNYNRDAGGSNGTGEEGPDMTIDPKGEIVVAGRFIGTVDFDPGTGITNLTSPTESGYISKFDTDGNFRWVKQLTVDTPVIRYVTPRSVATDAMGNIYIAGTFIGNADFDPDTAKSFPLSAQVASGFVMKLDSTGAFVWARKIGTDINPMLTRHNANAVVVDAAGDVYVTGGYMESVSFGSIQLTSTGLSDIYVTKLDGAGNFIWAKSVGTFFDGEQGTRLTLDATGNLYVTGTYRGTADFDPGPGITNLSTNGATDVFVLKLTPAGSFLWAKGYGGPGDYEQIQSIEVRGDDIYTVGRMVGTVNFNPNGYYYLTAGSANSYYPGFFIHKMSQNPASIRDVAGSLGVSIYPNPAEDQITITLTEKGRSEATVSAFDMQGRMLLTETIHSTSSQVDIRTLPAGNYILKVQSGDKYAVKKITIL